MNIERNRRKLQWLLAKYEAVRRSPSMWGIGPDYGKAYDALRERMQ